MARRSVPQVVVLARGRGAWCGSCEDTFVKGSCWLWESDGSSCVSGRLHSPGPRDDAVWQSYDEGWRLTTRGFGSRTYLSLCEWAFTPLHFCPSGSRVHLAFPSPFPPCSLSVCSFSSGGPWKGLRSCHCHSEQTRCLKRLWKVKHPHAEKVCPSLTLFRKTESNRIEKQNKTELGSFPLWF